MGKLCQMFRGVGKPLIEILMWQENMSAIMR